MMASLSKISEAMSEIRSLAIIFIQEVDEFEVLMLKCYQDDDVFSGVMMFPAKKMASHDDVDDLAELTTVWGSLSKVERGFFITAIREAFDETGLMLGRNAENNMINSDLLSVGKAIGTGELSFYEYVGWQDITLDLQALTLFLRWQTPPRLGRRFDIYFYLAAAPKGQTSVADVRKVVKTEWIPPQDALNLAKNNHRKMLFPTRMNLKMLGEVTEYDMAVNQAKVREIQKVEPKVEQRGEDRCLILDLKFGYGHVDETIESFHRF